MSEHSEEQVTRIGVVLEQASTVVDGVELTAVRAADGFVYARLASLCAALGLDEARQQESIDEHAVLTEGLLQFPLVSGTRVVMRWCLRTNLIALWVATVPVKRLKPDKQERVYFYQKRVADVLDRLFIGLDTASETSALVETEPAYAEGLTIARMALEQAQQAQQKADTVGGHVDTLESRIQALEARLMPREQISEEQATQIADLVKQAAITLSAKMGGGNLFGTVYGQLYRAFGVTSYKSITIAQFPKAVAWLERMIRENS